MTRLGRKDTSERPFDDLEPATRPIQEQAEQSDTPPDSRWWFCHFFITASFVATMAFVFFAPYLPLHYAPTPTVELLLLLWIVGIFVAFIGSLIGYHKEAKAMKDAGIEWVPGRWWCTAGHIILTPWIAAPIYLLDRWLHIGLDWRLFMFWKR